MRGRKAQGTKKYQKKKNRKSESLKAWNKVFIILTRKPYSHKVIEVE